MADPYAILCFPFEDTSSSLRYFRALEEEGKITFKKVTPEIFFAWVANASKINLDIVDKYESDYGSSNTRTVKYDAYVIQEITEKYTSSGSGENEFWDGPEYSSPVAAKRGLSFGQIKVNSFENGKKVSFPDHEPQFALSLSYLTSFQGSHDYWHPPHTQTSVGVNSKGETTTNTLNLAGHFGHMFYYGYIYFVYELENNKPAFYLVHYSSRTFEQIHYVCSCTVTKDTVVFKQTMTNDLNNGTRKETLTYKIKDKFL